MSKTAGQTNSTSLPTLDQRRARHAWEAVISLAKTNGDGKRQYTSDANTFAREAKKLPMRIMASGLGASLAFLLAKAKKKKAPLLGLHDRLTKWVVGEQLISLAKRPDSLMESVVEGDVDFLRRATDETIAYLQWLNRFAEAEGLGDVEED